MATVLVTGGSSGIGLATVRRLAAAGDRVFRASRHQEAAPLPADVVPLPADVAGPAACEKAVRSVIDAAGRLDALEPPARIVVGQDAAAMEGQVRQASAESLAAPLRDYVAGLAA